MPALDLRDAPTPTTVDRAGNTKPQAAPLSTPLPTPPHQPANSAGAGHARDFGGTGSPTMGTLASSWRPETITGRLSAAGDLTAHGRTVRYSGPPS
ncbi:hypothetical protein ACWEOZ_25710 [Actinoplanes sp. NPDC004185]